MSDLEERKQACRDSIQYSVSEDQLNKIINELHDPYHIAMKCINRADEEDIEIVEEILNIKVKNESD